MQKSYKELLRGLVNKLRLTLAMLPDGNMGRGDLDQEVERLGFAADGTITALDALPNPTAAEVRAYRAAEAQLARLDNRARVEARHEFVERAAYSWINRLLALRALEARGLIAETLRANPDYEGIPESLFVLRAMEPARTAGPDGGWWAVIEDACRTQAQLLPGLFDLDDPNAALRPSTTALRTCLQALGDLRLDPVLADPDAIGWAYQFYQEEAKTLIYAKLGAGGKVETRSEIAAATQLFTEPYMVAWLLQNSLGRSYAEAYPTTRLTASWEYYIDPAKINPDQPAAEPFARPRFTLDELTVLDPCMGSGHFLRAAFDLLFAMYQEQHPDWSARTVANRILERHLFGIDIDPRAAQLAALTLVLRAWERVQQAERSPATYAPPRLNLATTPKLPAGALDRHLARYADDAIYRPVLAKLFEALEQAPLLGSLLRPEEHLDAAIDALMTPNKRWQPALLSDDTAQQAALVGIQSEERSALRARLLERLGASFVKEATDADVASQLLGREASEGVHLVQLLSRKYAIVATNPPYMGSKNMHGVVRHYVEKNYKAGKRDLYAAFILRCLELTHYAGRVAMITQQSWMFLKSFAELRALPEDKREKTKSRPNFMGLLLETSIEVIAHLGPNAFEEISGEVVQSTMFTLAKIVPPINYNFLAFRTTIYASPLQKAESLRGSAKGQAGYKFRQFDCLAIERAPLAYWLTPGLIKLFSSLSAVGSKAYVRQGICTTNDTEFVRFTWETGAVSFGKRWYLFSKGGGMRRWSGFEQSVVDWELDGSRVKNHQEEKPGAIHWSGRMPDPKYLFRFGWTFSRVSGGTLAVREMPNTSLFGHGSPIAIAFNSEHVPILGFWLNTYLYTFLLRALTQNLNAQEGYVQKLPLPDTVDTEVADRLIRIPIAISKILNQRNLCEWQFEHDELTRRDPAQVRALEATYTTIEGYREHLAFQSLHLNSNDYATVTSETGRPAGWNLFIAGYDTLPQLATALNLPMLPQTVLDHLAHHERIQSTADEFARLKAQLRALYAAGPGGKSDDADDATETGGDGENGDDEEAAVAGAYIPIPTETFVEELSVKLQIHPISVYWRLEELRGEGARCLPEERRLLEDRLTVIVLRLLGHRWPKQIEAGEAVPEWADGDGVIPLTSGTGEATLAERVRSRLRAEEGDLGAQQTEALLQELTGRDLAEWLRRDFFTRHQRQFKKRPIAWHLRSTPQGRGKRSNAAPAFECFVYYHATDSDILARIRTRYIEPLIQAERNLQVRARQAGLPGVGAGANETLDAQATARIQELEEFAIKLRQVEEAGFACAELEKLAANEAQDRWSGDGVRPPANRPEFLAQEQAWRVDINDGVRVNIVPLQAAGLLAADVLAKKELPKAVADRARWRADERRWVRAGKLPRCGWMDERVPESPAWTEQAPQREAERQRLEEKRKKVLAELGSTNG